MRMLVFRRAVWLNPAAYKKKGHPKAAQV